MPEKDTREIIVEAADVLFYQQGFDATSFADIAKAVNISRGNFYYHFKSKDEILAAVIDLRRMKTRALLQHWEQQDESALERIRSFIRILIMNQSKITQYGCPVGSLCGELAKLDHSALGDANEIFLLFRHWLRKQFVTLGFARQADAYAMHVLVLSQGVAAMANAFDDEKTIHLEVKRAEQWLATLVEQKEE